MVNQNKPQPIWSIAVLDSCVDYFSQGNQNQEKRERYKDITLKKLFATKIENFTSFA